jgi:hypothetical protein
MTQTFTYPARVEVDEAGFWLVTFPDIPEAGTGARDREAAIREASDAELARHMGLSVAKVRDLLDLDHRSDIGEIEAALAALGTRLIVGVDAA